MTKTEMKKRKKVAKLLEAGLPIPEDLQRFLLPPGEAFDALAEGEAEEAVADTDTETEADITETSEPVEPLVEVAVETETIAEPVAEAAVAVAELPADVLVPEDSTPEPVPAAPLKKVRKTKKQLAEEAAALEAELATPAPVVAVDETETTPIVEATAPETMEDEPAVTPESSIAVPEETVAPAEPEVVAAETPAAEPAKPATKPRKGRLIIDVEVPEQAPEPAADIPAPLVAEVSAAPTADTPAITEPAPAKAKKKSKKGADTPVEATAPESREHDGPLFADLGLPASLLAAVSAAGFESPTPIQARSIPPLLAGKDLVGQAQTGTGKTAAFALPILAGIDPSLPGTQALVVVPTRELAIQAAEQFVRFGGGIRVVPVYGGQPIDRQFRALMKPPAVVVGTPGRLLDHLRRGSLNLGTVRFCALDEADEMLSFGFIDDIEAILAELPEVRQTTLFSATMPPRIAALADKFLRNPVRIEIESKQRTVETVRQFVYEVPPGRKREALARILDMEIPGPTIVFCRTRAETQDLADTLRLRGYDAEPLHGDMAQAERDRIMKKFRDEQTDLLVATDVAARGLDISGVTHVVNFDLPWDVEQYIHRIGRTGRAGREGDAISIIEPKERRNLRRFEYQLGVRLEQRRLPSSADIAARRREVFSSKVRERLETGGFDDQLEAVSELSESWDVADIAAAALHLLWEASGIAKSESVEDELAAEGERPEPGMARLFVSLGRMDRVRPNELVQVIRTETGLGAGAIGTIDIMDRCSFIEVPQEHAEQVIQVLGSVPYRGRRPKCGYARPKDNEGPGRRF